MRIESQRSGERVCSVTPTAKYKVGDADLGGTPRIAWIQFCCPVKFSERALPFTTATIDRSSGFVAKRTGRLGVQNPAEFLQSTLVVTMAPGIKQAPRQSGHR